MADINLITISPSQLSGPGEAGMYDVSRFARKYLAQGDSWFSIGHIPPWCTTNLLEQMVLGRSSVAVNCAKPGAELAKMTDTSTERVFLNLLNGNVAWTWDAILVSGGGNDLVAAASSPPQGGPELRLLLRADEWQGATAGPARYLSPAGWSTFAHHMEDVLTIFLAQRDKKKVNRGTPPVLHTYDYVTARNAPAGPKLGPWLFAAFNNLYRIAPEDWPALADRLIDQLAEMWIALAVKYADRNMHVVDSRHTITRAAAGSSGVSGDWENEIHPTPNGYALLGTKWRATLDALP